MACRASGVILNLILPPNSRGLEFILGGVIAKRYLAREEFSSTPALARSLNCTKTNEFQCFLLKNAFHTGFIMLFAFRGILSPPDYSGSWGREFILGEGLFWGGAVSFV